MRNILLIVLALNFTQLAFAEVDDDFSPVTQIEDADYICTHKLGVYALKVTNPARVWQGKIRNNVMPTEGFEIQNVKLAPGLCVHCYSFLGTLNALGAYTVEGATYIHDSEIFLKIRMTGDQGKTGDLPEMRCRPVL